MNSLLLNQKVRKRRRRKPELVYSSRQDKSRRVSFGIIRQKAYRPKGVISLFRKNSRVIEEIKQNPAKNPDNKHEKPHLDYRTARKRSFSIAVPAVPIAFILLLAVGIFLTVNGQGAFDWIGRDVVSSSQSLGKDDGAKQKLSLYAGVSPLENTLTGSVLGNSVLEPENSGKTIPLDLTETFAWQSYRVNKGDSVSKIAAVFSVSMDAIIASNGITNVRTLKEGEVLRIPNMDGIPYLVKNGDSLSKISISMGVPLEAILDANDIQSDVINAGTTLFIPGARMNREDLRLALGELFIYPLKGAKLSSPFGWRNDPISGERRHHAALDLSAPLGTPVNAAMEGKVTALGYDRTYGNFIIISHPGGYQSMYAHLNSTSVKNGDQVAQGGRIGAVGTTGYSTGPHLHFAIFKNSRAVNPLDYLSVQR